MNNKKFSTLRNKLLAGLSSLIELENEEGGLPISENSKKTRSGDNQNIKYQPDQPYLISDPRITFTKNLLRLLLDCAKPPFAFRLKKLKNWLVKTNIESFLSQVVWNCRVNCVFCYLKGNPPFMRLRKRISSEETETRLKYLDLKHNLGLVGPKILENTEVLHNPQIAEILREIRKKEKKKEIEVCTNGSSLDLKMVKILARAAPLFLIVSLNSADPVIRKRLMNDPHPETAIASLPLLKKHRVPFVVSIVTWPGLPFSDIERTIRYAEKNDAYAVRLCLFGYSRFFSRKKLCDAQKHWLKVVRHFHPLSRRSKVLVEVIPHIFVQNQIYERADLPRLIGAIKNSPAYNAGIKTDDLILEINEQPVDSIEEARELLISHLKQKVRIKFRRNQSTFEVEIKNRPKNCYPYLNEEMRLTTPFGIALAENEISHEDVIDIGRHISVHDAKNVLILASSRAHPFLKYTLKRYDIAGTYGAKIRIAIPRNRFFGGSIDSADLLTVEDCIQCIKENLRRLKPDLIILPFSPFSDWGRDLTGRNVLDIEREIGVPVKFIYNYAEQYQIK
jgi:hypothetical protein